jgi:hypothetical protein
MKNLYRHYRQITVSSRNGEKPEVEGYEEIWRNGKKEVHRWTDEDDLKRLPIDASELFDFWNDRWGEFKFPAIELGENSEWESSVRSPRYINPMEVEVEEPVVERKFILGEQLGKVKQFFTKGWRKIQRIGKRLPLAWKAAWRELNVD